MAAVESAVPPAVAESKSARKKKAKAAEAAAAADGKNHISTTPTVPDASSKDNSVMAEADNSAEHPYLKEMQKQIRNINKKLAAMHKLDAILAENPGISLDELIAQRKINADQKAAAQKKPQLFAQLADLEERQEHYRKFDSDYQIKFNKQRDELTAQHQKEIDSLKEELRVGAISASSAELSKKLLVFSQFLRAAAAKRTIVDDADTDESRAFEGALLLVYGGDEKAVETAINLIEGTAQHVPCIEGTPLPVTFAQVKKASLEHAPFQTEEAWVEQVAEATSGEASVELLGTSDPTVTHAGLTEIDAAANPNGFSDDSIPLENASVAPVSAGDVGNLASERWDTDAAGPGAEKNGLEDSFEMIPRPSDEVDIPVETAAGDVATQPQSTSWADEPTQEAVTGIGNQAGETWNVKAPGEQTDNSWAGTEPTPTNGWAETPTESAVPDDGFSEVPGRHRGRGGHRGRGVDGESRGRGGRRGNFRGGRGGGDGEFRGRGGFRGNRGDGEFRGGRGGRGRGAPRGNGNPVAQS